jgi:hypothetical protein
MLRIVAAFHDDIFSDPDSPTGLNKVQQPYPFLTYADQVYRTSISAL